MVDARCDPLRQTSQRAPLVFNGLKTNFATAQTDAENEPYRKIVDGKRCATVTDKWQCDTCRRTQIHVRPNVFKYLKRKHTHHANGHVHAKRIDGRLGNADQTIAKQKKEQHQNCRTNEAEFLSNC